MPGNNSGIDLQVYVSDYFLYSLPRSLRGAFTTFATIVTCSSTRVNYIRGDNGLVLQSLERVAVGDSEEPIVFNKQNVRKFCFGLASQIYFCVFVLSIRSVIAPRCQSMSLILISSQIIAAYIRPVIKTVRHLLKSPRGGRHNWSCGL